MKFLRRPELWVGILAFLVRLWFLEQLAGSPFFEPIPGGNDRNLYDALAQRVAHGSIFPQGVFESMPLYPWFLGLIYAVAGANLYCAGWIGAFLDAATTMLLVHLAIRLGALRVAATLVGLLYALYPTAIIYSTMTMPNTLNAFLLTGFVMLSGSTLRMNRTPKNPENVIPSGSEESPAFSGGGFERFLTSFGMTRKNVFQQSLESTLQWFGLGLLAGVTALGFAGMLLIFLAWMVYRVIVQIQTKQICLPPFAFCLLGFAIPILPVTLHNWRVERQFVLVTAHGGFNFYMGNHEEATGYPVQIEGFRGDAGSLLADARAAAERIEGRKLSAAEFSAHWSRRAWSFILAHPLAELKLLGLKFMKFWNRSEYDDMRLAPMLRLGNVAFESPLWPGFAWIGWLGLAGLFLARGCGSLKVITATGIIGVLCFFVTARYRLTFAPLLAALGAMGVSEIWKAMGEARHSESKIKNQKSKKIPHGAVFCIAGLVTWSPLPQSDFRALDRYNTAAYLMARGMPREALEQAQKGLMMDQTHPDLHFVAGNALWALGKAREAGAAYTTTIHLKPSHASAHYNLAVVYMELKDPASASREAALALKFDPQHPHAGEALKEAEEANRQKKRSQKPEVKGWK